MPLWLLLRPAIHPLCATCCCLEILAASNLNLLDLLSYPSKHAFDVLHEQLLDASSREIPVALAIAEDPLLATKRSVRDAHKNALAAGRLLLKTIVETGGLGSTRTVPQGLT